MLVRIIRQPIRFRDHTLDLARNRRIPIQFDRHGRSGDQLLIRIEGDVFHRR
jgi:hypothetical protein